MDNATVGGGDLKLRNQIFRSNLGKKCIKRRVDASVVEGIVADDVRGEVSLAERLARLRGAMEGEDQLRGVRSLRMILSSPRPLIDEVLEAGLLPSLAACLGSPSQLAQYEAAWALTNVAAGTSLHVRYLVESGAVSGLLDLLRSPSEEVREQSAWAIGNVAGDPGDFRAFVLERGGMAALLDALQSSCDPGTLRTTSWAICNLCIDNPDFRSIRLAVPVLGRFLSHECPELAYTCAQALSHLSKGKDRIQTTLESGLIPTVIELLEADRGEFTLLLLKIIVNVSQGTENQIVSLLKNDILDALTRFTTSSKESIRYKAFSIVSNLTFGKVEFIDYVIRKEFVMAKILSSIGDDSERVVKQAVFILRNIAHRGTREHAQTIADITAIRKLCLVLPCDNSCLTLAALVCLEKLLEAGEQQVQKEGTYNEVALKIEECKGLERIEQLQSHPDQDVYHKAFEIMEKYFTEEEINIRDKPKF